MCKNCAKGFALQCYSFIMYCTAQSTFLINGVFSWVSVYIGHTTLYRPNTQLCVISNIRAYDQRRIYASSVLTSVLREIYTRSTPSEGVLQYIYALYVTTCVNHAGRGAGQEIRVRTEALKRMCKQVALPSRARALSWCMDIPGTLVKTAFFTRCCAKRYSGAKCGYFVVTECAVGKGLTVRNQTKKCPFLRGLLCIRAIAVSICTTNVVHCTEVVRLSEGQFWVQPIQ